MLAIIIWLFYSYLRILLHNFEGETKETTFSKNEKKTSTKFLTYFILAYMIWNLYRPKTKSQHNCDGDGWRRLLSQHYPPGTQNNYIDFL